MSDRTARIGTRASSLALAQTEIVASRLRDLGIAVRVVPLETSGDRARAEGSRALERGAFVKELEVELLAARVDLAVHSAKDLPTETTAGTELAVFLARGDGRDALVTRDGSRLADLPAGSRIGTESPRRAAFLRAERADVVVQPIRGNVDTRLAKLDAGEVDGLVVAAAGLERLGRAARIAEAFSVLRMVPAPGQGALVVQSRAGDEWTRTLRTLDDWGTRAEVTAERAFLHAMGGGCRAPFAGHASWSRGELAIDAAALRADGGTILRERLVGSDEDAASLGERVARRLLARGAAALAESTA